MAAAGFHVGGNRRASRLQQAEMVDNDDRIAVSLDVRQPFVQDAPAKQIDRQTMFAGGSESAVQTGMVRVHRQAVAHSYANARAPGVAAHFATTSSIAGLVASTGVTTRNLFGKVL
jgi:hypothetical protein